MKRVISLFLALVLLFSLVPAVFAEGNEQAGVALVIGAPEKKTATDYETNEQVVYYRVPVKVQNKTSETVTINAAECYIRYDETNFSCGDIQIGESDYVDAYEYDSATTKEWNKQSSASNGLVTMGMAANQNQSRYFLKIKSNSEAELFAINLKRASDIENDDYALTLAEPFVEAGGNPKQNLIGNKIEDKFYTQKEGSLDCTSKETISVTDGKAPTLGSVTISPEATSVFSSGEEFTLSAKSASGKDITSLVTFKIQKDGTDFSTGLTIAENKLTVASSGSLADVGTYTVVATPNGDGSTGSASADFTITPKTITNPSVTVIGFGKSAVVGEVSYSVDNLLTPATWYEGTGDLTTLTPVGSTETFKAATTYTLVLTLTPTSGNYKLDENTTVTVMGVGDNKTVPLTKNSDGSCSVTVTGMTGAKDIPEVTMNPITATFGDKLSIYTPEGTATYGGKTVNGTYAWEHPDQTVGNAGTKTIYAVFTPNESEKYSAVTAPVTVTVNKKIIAFTLDNFKWVDNNGNDITADAEGKYHFTYDGEPHGINVVAKDEATDAREHVTVTAIGEDDLKTNAGVYEQFAGAEIKAGDDGNYELSYAGTTPGSLNISAVWVIDKATFTPGNVNKPVSYGTTEVTILRSELTGVPANSVTIVAARAASTDENRLITEEPTVNDDGSITLKLRQTDKTGAGNVQDSITLTYTSANYVTEGVSSTITINIVDKVTDDKTVSIRGPESVEYGTAYDFTYDGVPADAQLKSTTYTNTETNVTSANKPEAVGSYKIFCTWESSTTIYTAEYVFAITPRNISNATAAIADLTYNGEEQTASLTVTDGEKTLIRNTDYTVKETSLKKTDADTYTVTITGMGNYTGTTNASFKINPAQIGESTIELKQSVFVYDGTSHKPTVTVEFRGNVLAEGSDYTVTDPQDAISAGEKSITVTGNGNYTGTAEKKFTINPKSLTNEMLTLGTETLIYNGKAQEMSVTLTDGDKTLVKDRDYTVEYTNNINAGTDTATVTVTGKGNYTGKAEKNFTINKKVISKPNDINIDVRYTDTAEKEFVLWQKTAIEDKAAVQETNYNWGYVEDPSAFFTVATRSYQMDGDRDGVKFGFKYQINGGLEVGKTHTVVVTLKYGPNYEPSDVTFNIVFTITDKDPQAALTYTGATTMTYNQSIPLSYTGGSGSGEVSYTVTNGTGAATVRGSTLTATKAGTVYLTVNKSGDDTYLDQSSTEPVTITINKATPTAPAEIKVDNTDTTLGELGREMVKKIGVSGTINWYDSDNKLITDPDNTKIEANKEYSWTFVPDPNDEISTNYKEISGKTTPYVRDDLSWLPGVINGGSNFTFHDVNRFDYYYDSVKWAADNGIASGTSRFAFSPDAVCTRAQTVTFLWRAAGSPLPRYRACPFTDVHANDYYYDAVLWAVEQGITTGLTATTFGPDETVTRGQVATFLYRAASAAKPNTFNPFMDVKPTAYNYDAILWAYDNRITTGTSTTTFSPDAFCTRAQIVTFLYRYYQGR